MNQNTKKILKISGLFVFFLIIFVYAFFRSSDLIFGVKIENVNIVDGSTTAVSKAEISGSAKNATSLTLNGRKISVDGEGNFNEVVALLLGYNVVTIRAEDKFGHIDEEDYKLIYKR